MGWDKATLAATMNGLWMQLGLTALPAIPKDTLGKMGLRGTPGLIEGPGRAGGGGGGGGGGRGGGGGGRR